MRHQPLAPWILEEHCPPSVVEVSQMSNILIYLILLLRAVEIANSINWPKYLFKRIQPRSFFVSPLLKTRQSVAYNSKHNEDSK